MAECPCSCPACVERRSRPTTIYALADPRSGEQRYVGRTVAPGKRLIDHVTRQDGSPRSEWVMSLVREGVMPRMDVLATDVRAEFAAQTEQAWIDRLRAQGCDLVNQQSAQRTSTVVCFRLDGEMSAWLEAYAEASGVPRSAVIIEAFEQYKAKVTRADAAQALRENFLAAR